ncbi:6-bladed beta-propeller [Candidatus Palauibacter sp.]|uniref:6-bladed beta-propeller n=1 Tax=Candidatus Palauibacter sp. TaxID=3101350 RepID=UPI003B5B6867
MLHVCIAASGWLSTTDRAGAQEVIELPGEDRWLEADFQEVYQVGAADGVAWQEFGRVRTVAFDGAGNLYVLDALAGRVIVVTPDGGLLRAVGRLGEGPGEFGGATSMAVMRDGRIVVGDLGQRAYLVFHADGEYERQVRPDGNPAHVSFMQMWPESGGESVVVGTQLAGGSYLGGFPEGTPRPLTRPIARLILTGDDVLRETIAKGWRPPRGEADVRRAFEPGLWVGPLPDGRVAFSDSSAYAIKIATAEDGVSHILTRPFFPEPVTERMERAERDRLIDEMVGGSITRTPGGVRAVRGGGSNRWVERAETMEFFEEAPVVLGLSTSWGGRIWVQRRGDQPHEDGPIDILTADGSYLGSFRTGATRVPDAFGPEGLAAFIERDGLNVQTVVVKRLPARVN